MPDLTGSETHANLLRAFRARARPTGGTSGSRSRPMSRGILRIASLFRSVADGETGHASGLLEFLARVGDPASGEPIGDSAENLRAAVVSETEDATQRYPQYARIAHDEGFQDIADWFETLVRAEQHQLQRFRAGLDELA